MYKLKTIWLLCALSPFMLLLISVAGCAGPTTQFSAYRGEQGAWPVSTGTTARSVDGMLVYENVPERPYEVLGSISTDNPYDNVDATLTAAVRRAREAGADAIIVTKNERTLESVSTFAYASPMGQSAYATGSARPMYSRHVTCYAIRWKGN